MTREAALAAFDEARDRFLVAFDRVPDDALDFLKPGDDYAVGGLLPHLTWGIEHYAGVLDRAVATGFGELRDQVDPADAERSTEAARRGLDATGRRPALDDLRQAHDGLVRRARELPEPDFDREAPVVYGDATEAHPTSAAVIASWLTDHYDEHVAHVRDLLAAYEARGR